MAPEPEILKRKRSRPSDWWAAAPATPQQDEPPAKKRGDTSNSNVDGKGIKDAPAAGNRGKSAKGKEVARDGENVEEDELQQKPLRGGRSSSGREELLGADGSSRASKKMEVKRRKATQEVNEEQLALKKGRRPASGQEKQQAEDNIVKKQPTKRRGRPSAAQAEEAHETPGVSRQSKSQRTERSSITEAQVLAAAHRSLRDMVQRRGKHTTANKKAEAEIEEDDEDPIAPQKRRLPRKRVDADRPIDELVVSDPKKKKKKRRSGVEMLEAEALALTTTEDYLKGRPRPAISKEVPSPDGLERGRKRTRHSDIHTQDVRPAISSIRDRQGKGRVHAQISDTELHMAGQSKRSRINSHEDQRVEVETASSRLQRSGPKKYVKPIIEKRTKFAKGSSVAEQPQRNMQRTRSSNEEAVEIVMPELPKSHKKASKAQARTQENNQSSKRKGASEHPESPHEKRRRIEKPSRQAQVSPEPEEAPGYQHLQAVTHRISRQTIEAKWEPLPSSCVERISQLLQDFQRPVVIRYNDERKKTQSTTALQMISRRLISKISKGLPFPQGTRNHREDDFDFEKILDCNRALEAQLTPVLHANELLEAQVSKEVALLESERERLAVLEANAKTTAASRSEAGRRLHWLLQASQGIMEVEGLKDDVDLSIAQHPRPLDLGLQEDEQLQTLAKDLHGHVDSIQGNIRQVEGIPQAISKSKAAVQATLFGHLDSGQYDEVVMGSE